MKLFKRLGIAFLIILVGIQFIPTSSNQIAEVASTSDFLKTNKVPEYVGHMLITSCYDCHSNITHYPWYNKIQPIGWLLESHINKGKEQLNFSEFGSYSVRKQKSKLKSMADQIEKDQMPLSSYTLIHRNARLTQESKKAFVDYLNALLDSLP